MARADWVHKNLRREAGTHMVPVGIQALFCGLTCDMMERVKITQTMGPAGIFNGGLCMCVNLATGIDGEVC